jgi:hypothetical protein
MNLIDYTTICEQAGPKQLVWHVALAEEADSAVISKHYFPWPGLGRPLSVMRRACEARLPR